MPTRSSWRRSGTWMLAVLVLAWGRAGLGAAAVLNLTPVADTTLFAEAEGNNLGRSDTLVVGSTGHGRPGRAVLRFGPGGVVPSGHRVTSARLEFSVTKVPPGGGVGSTFQVRRVLRSWRQGAGDGNLGRPALAEEATWLARSHPETLWSAPGGGVGVDFGPVRATVAVDGTGRYAIESEALAEDVRSWIEDPAGDFGWVLISDRESEALTARRLGSLESALAASRPRLVLAHEPAPPAGPVLVSPRVDGGRLRFEFQGEAGNLYEVQFRESPAGPAAWQVLTNVVVKLVPIRVEVTDPTPVGEGPRSRFYRVADVGDVD